MELKKLVGKLIYWASETTLGMRVILWCINHARFIVPIRSLRETARLIAVQNPRPLFPVHILIMPKRTIRRFMDLSPADNDLLGEIVEAVQSLVKEMKLQQDGFQLIVNGGKYQTVPQLHFHLISGERIQPQIVK